MHQRKGRPSVGIGREALRRALVALTIPSVLLSSAPAVAQSLDTATSSALASSYTLRAQEAGADGAEARLRGSVDQFLPTVAYSVDSPIHSRIIYQPNPEPTSLGLGDIPIADPKFYTFSVNFPLFDGFRRWNDFQSSRLLSEASRHLVAGAAQQTLFDTSVAYLSVVRDTRIVSARLAAITSVQRILASTEAKFAVNDATRTDVALARSRVADAQAAMDAAQANLAATRIEFTRLTRLDPDSLTPPTIRDLLPANEQAFVDLVRAANPKLIAANLDAESAVYQARASLAELAPQVSLQYSHTIETGYSPVLDKIDDKTARIVAKIPIYTPGTLPRISEANALARQRGYEAEDQELQVLASARAAYQRRRAAIAQVVSAAQRVTSLRATVKGMEIERAAGFRTILDELNLRAELADAEVAEAALVTQRDTLLLQLAAAANLLNDRMLQAEPPQVRHRERRAAPKVAARSYPVIKGDRRDVSLLPLGTAIQEASAK